MFWMRGAFCHPCRQEATCTSATLPCYLNETREQVANVDEQREEVQVMGKSRRARS
jgi:hypothetical protein